VNYESVVNKLIEKGKTISTMESCTGGAIANEITMISGASEVLKFSAVTYSNEFKIKMGVSKEVIDKFTVYSEETAKEMSKKISDYTSSDYGIGVTGKINRVDNSNPGGKDNVIYVSVYDREKDDFYVRKLEALKISRQENKERIAGIICSLLDSML